RRHPLLPPARWPPIFREMRTARLHSCRRTNVCRRAKFSEERRHLFAPTLAGDWSAFGDKARARFLPSNCSDGYQGQAPAEIPSFARGCARLAATCPDRAITLGLYPDSFAPHGEDRREPCGWFARCCRKRNRSVPTKGCAARSGHIRERWLRRSRRRQSRLPESVHFPAARDLETGES